MIKDEETPGEIQHRIVETTFKRIIDILGLLAFVTTVARGVPRYLASCNDHDRIQMQDGLERQKLQQQKDMACIEQSGVECAHAAKKCPK